MNGGGGGGGGPSPGANATAFLARTSGLDTTHRNAYIDLINGLDTDSLFGKFDCIHIYATQDSTTALLNLVSSSFTGVTHGAPTFTADRGFTGVESSNTVYIDTQFNPALGTPKYVQDSAHLSVWNVTNVSSGWPSIGSSGATVNAYLYPKFTTDGKAYIRINVAAGAGQNVTNSDASGHHVGNRSSSSQLDGYRNASNILSAAGQTSGAPASVGFLSLGWNNNGTAEGNGAQQAMISFGSSLSSTDVTNFYNRLRTFMTVVGVP